MEESPMNILKNIPVYLALFLLLGCNNSSSDKTEESQALLEKTETLETTKVKLAFNLPADSGLLDTQSFSLDDPLTYHASTSTFICIPSGEQALLHLYFINTEAKKWDVYFKLDDDLLNIEAGEIGGTGQSKATLEFEDNGSFIRQVPYIINSAELQYAENSYQIEFDFYSLPTTSTDEAFNVKNLDANGC